MAKTTDPLINLSLNKEKGGTEQFERPGDYEGIRTKRIFAYAIDVICIFFVGILAGAAATLLGIITLGLLSPLLAILLACVPLAYHTITIGGPWNATVGMKMFGLEVALANDEEIDYVTAFIHAALFYFSVALTSFLILLVSLFNPQGKVLHDYLTSSTVRNKRSDLKTVA